MSTDLRNLKRREVKAAMPTQQYEAIVSEQKDPLLIAMNQGQLDQIMVRYAAFNPPHFHWVLNEKQKEQH